MPTLIAIDISDPAAQDAWGLHPTPDGLWTAGAYVRGTVCAHNNAIWFAKVQTAGEPGVSADWQILVTVGALSLDGNGLLPIANLPITRGQALRALRANGGSVGGAAYPDTANWLKIVENWHGADEGDLNIIAFEDAFWPIGGLVWSNAQIALAAALGSFDAAALAALQAYAITHR
jgi:hypothetical protein